MLRVKEFDVVTPDDRKLFSVRNLALKPGDRAVVLGRNGVGKLGFIRGVVDSFGQEYLCLILKHGSVTMIRSSDESI